MLRPVLTLLVALCLLARAAWPALPTYVCAGMGGVRLQAPCCPDEGDHADTTAWTARCCQPEGAQKGDAQAAPPAPQRPEFSALVLLPWHGASAAPPPPPSFPPPPRAGAPPSLCALRHVVLRI